MLVYFNYLLTLNISQVFFLEHQNIDIIFNNFFFYVIIYHNFIVFHITSIQNTKVYFMKDLFPRQIQKN